MFNNLKRALYIVMAAMFTMSLFACKQTPKHKWMEVGSETDTVKVQPGVHPERGSVSDAVPIVSAIIIVPTGRDVDDKIQSVKYLYDMEELTADGIDEAMKELGLLSSSSLFCNLLLEDVEDSDVLAGPGADNKETRLTKKGIVRYVVLESDLVNEGDEKKYDVETHEGLITNDDIKTCIEQTFEENFQLVSCDIEMVTMDEYNRLYGNKE